MDLRRAGLNTFAGRSWPAGRTLPITGLGGISETLYHNDLANLTFNMIKLFIVQSTARQTIHFGLCTALISRALALILNCKYIA
jgi:hypothetical protein